jgi:hypothetical protein
VNRSSALEKPWALYDNKEYAEAFEEAHALLDNLQGEDVRDAQRLLGLACLRQRQFEQASLWWTKACLGSEEADDWVQLAISAALQGRNRLGEEAFEQVRLIQQAARYNQGPGFYQHLFWYASAVSDHGDHEQVQPLLDELAQAYRRVHRTDTTQLYVIGLPFLSSMLVLAIRHFHGARQHAQGVTWLRSLAEALDEEGREQVEQAVRDLQALGEKT